MNKKSIIIYIYICSFLFAFSQIGINTESPTATLSIKSISDTIPIVLSRNYYNQELVRVLNNGYFGIETSNPITKIDLRGSNNGEIGLGKTTMEASDAGAGAIRYNNGIEYSDGESWIKLAVLPTKAYVVAKNDIQLTVPANLMGALNWDNWTTIIDQANNFNSKTGVFTTPRTGVYSVSCTGLSNITIAQTTTLRVELILITTNQTVKSGVASPVTSTNKGKTMNISFVNKAFVYLRKGETLYFSIYNGMSETMQTSSDGEFNTLTISEM